MNLQSIQWTRRLNFLALSGWLIISIGLAVISFLYFGVDFRGYYAASRVLMEGGNPYDYHQVAPVLMQITGKMGNNPYYYPPWFAWLFVPMALFSFQIARGMWMAFNLAMWNISLWKLGQIVNWHEKGWRLYSLFILSTLTFGWITMRYEQASILVFFILILTILSIRNRQWNLTGFLLAFLLIKPNITLITVLMICLWFISKKQWQPVIAMAAMLAVLSALAIWITPNLLQPFFEPGFGQGLTVALDGPDQIIVARINTTMFDWLGVFGVKGNFRLFIYLLFVVISFAILALTLHRSKSLLALMSISLLISFVITPYALQYDYAPLVIVLFWALSLCISDPKLRRGGLVLAMFVFSVSVWQQNIAWGYWIVVGLVMLAVFGNFKRHQSLDLSSNT
jgi:hypothetical protein